MKTLQEIIEEEHVVDYSKRVENIVKKVFEQVKPKEKEAEMCQRSFIQYAKGWNDCKDKIQSNITTILGK